MWTTAGEKRGDWLFSSSPRRSVGRYFPLLYYLIFCLHSLCIPCSFWFSDVVGLWLVRCRHVVSYPAAGGGCMHACMYVHGTVLLDSSCSWNVASRLRYPACYLNAGLPLCRNSG